MLGANLSLLPTGFADADERGALRHEEDASTLRKLFAEAGVTAHLASRVTPLPVSVKKSAEWVAPVLFVGASLWSQNPVGVQIAVEVIATFVSERLRGTSGKGEVKLSIAVERTRRRETRLLTYEGPIDGLKQLPEAIKRLADE
jgi:hypothetical protein